MDLDLVGYLLGLLDPEDLARTEDALRTDPIARAELARVRSNLAPLAMARDEVSPPAGLAERTIALVADHAHGGIIIPSRPPILGPDREPIIVPSRWGRIDVAIAASILILVGGLGLSGLGRAQKERDIRDCQNNLRQLGYSLASYGNGHGGRLPQVSDQPPMNVAGSFVPMLRDGGYLPGSGMPNCPLVNVRAGGPNNGGYAYSLGYRGPDGGLRGLRTSDGDLQPIMADRPIPISHGSGFNVLFIGGNVRFCTSPNVGIGGDHIFLNQANAIAAGLNSGDAVLADWQSSP